MIAVSYAKTMFSFVKICKLSPKCLVPFVFPPAMLFYIFDDICKLYILSNIIFWQIIFSYFFAFIFSMPRNSFVQYWGPIDVAHALLLQVPQCCKVSSQYPQMLIVITPKFAIMKTLFNFQKLYRCHIMVTTQQLLVDRVDKFYSLTLLNHIICICLEKL